MTSEQLIIEITQLKMAFQKNSMLRFQDLHRVLDLIQGVGIMASDPGVAGSLVTEEFEYIGSQVFTTSFPYAQVHSVSVKGVGPLSQSQYSLAPPDKVIINDELETSDYIIISYSRSSLELVPYYTQVETDILLNAKENISNKATNFNTINDTLYPSIKATKDYVDSKTPTDYSKIVYINTTDPSTATIFDLNNPPIINDNSLKADVNNLYVATDLIAWVYRTSPAGYVTKAVTPTGSNFYLVGTSIDSGSTKTAAIERTGTIGIGAATAPNHAVTKAQLDSAISSVVISDATTTSKGVVKLAGDLGGTADSPTTPTAIHLAGTETISGLKTFLNGTFGMRNVANTFTSFFTNSNTASRTYTLPDKSGNISLDGVTTKPRKDITGTSYTLLSGDNLFTLYTTNVSPVTITIPSGLTINQEYELIQYASGQVSFITSGTTLRYQSYELASTAELYSRVTISYIDTEIYQLIGQLQMI